MTAIVVGAHAGPRSDGPANSMAGGLAEGPGDRKVNGGSWRGGDGVGRRRHRTSHHLTGSSGRPVLV